MTAPRLVLLVAFWLVLVSSASLLCVPFISLIAMMLVPAAAVGLVFAVLLIPPSSRPALPTRRLGAVMSAGATLFLAGLASSCALQGSWWLLAGQRGSEPGSAGVWLLLAGLNVLGAIVFAAGNKLRLGGDRRTNVILTLAMGSAPLATLICLFGVSRVLPLSA